MYFSTSNINRVGQYRCVSHRQVFVIKMAAKEEIPHTDPPEDCEVWHMEQTLEGVTAEQYWPLAFTMMLETYQYLKQGTGSFTELSRTTRDDGIIERKVEIVPGQRLTDTLMNYWRGDDYKPMIYRTVQTKNLLERRMSFANEFNEFWVQYFPYMDGEIQVEDDPTLGESGGVRQIVTMRVKMCVGWECGSWVSKALGNVANWVTSQTLQQAIADEMQAMMSYAKEFILDHQAHKEA